MLKVGVMVSGGGTNLQAIIDGVHSGVITNAKLEVVISNKKDAYALTRAKDNGIKAESVCIKDYATRDEFNKALIGTIDSYNLDLIVLAGFLVVLPEELINKYRNYETEHSSNTIWPTGNVGCDAVSNCMCC